tara:strand:- start:114 stop:440 length:327 start_codon:yes stop_codon:yes gene_type:complete
MTIKIFNTHRQYDKHGQVITYEVLQLVREENQYEHFVFFQDHSRGLWYYVIVDVASATEPVLERRIMQEYDLNATIDAVETIEGPYSNNQHWERRQRHEAFAMEHYTW